MTERGKLVCWECDDFATWLDENKTSIDYWCNQHCPPKSQDNIVRQRIKQELIDTLDGSQVWYPLFLINNEWVGWPLVKDVKHQMWIHHLWWNGTNRWAKRTEIRK